MRITEIGYHTLLEHGQTVFHPDGLEQALLLLTHAPLTLSLGGAPLRAEAGDAIIVSAGTPLRYTPAEQDLLCDWVIFDPASELSFYKALSLPENTLLRFGDTDFLAALLEQLCAEYYASNPRCSSASRKRADLSAQRTHRAAQSRIMRSSSACGRRSMRTRRRNGRSSCFAPR